MSNTRELSQLASVISVADETRNIGIGTTTPTSKLHVSGNVRVSGVVTATSFSGDGSALTGISGGSSSSQFVTTSAGIHTLSNVGIGTTNPTSRLHVSGDAIVTGVVTATTFIGALTGTASSTTNIPNLTGAITSVGNAAVLGSFTSSQLATALTDETGSGANVFATSPVLVTPSLGIATAQSLVVSGVSTVGSLSIGATSVISSARQLQNIASLDATTTATIESAVANAPNTFTDLSVSGISTLGVTSATNLTAQSLNVSGIITATQLSTGASGTGVNISTDTISGPATLTIDPAAVGDNTGAVRIKGDLYVDGTQFIVNSTTIELADFNVGIASTVGTNALLDGAGIGIGSIGIRKTLTWNNSSTALKSSEDFDISSGKVYKIGGTSVLSNNTLGSGVVTSSLTSVGTLGQLNVTGVSTFSNGPVLIGSATSTGTASQPLQVTGGAYVSGNLGIGVTNPSYKLHIAGGDIYAQNGYIQSYSSVMGSSGTWAVFGSNTGTNPILINRNADPNGSKDLFIDNSGNVLIGTTSATGTASQRLQVTGGAYVSGSVGIGITNPTSKLQVAGSLSAYNSTSTDGAIVEAFSEIVSQPINLGPGGSLDVGTIPITNNNNWRAIVRGTYSNNYEGGGLTPPSFYLELNSTQNTIPCGNTSITVSRNTSTNRLKFLNNNDTFRVTFTGTIEITVNNQSGQPTNSVTTIGRVGVGTINPSAKLDVEDNSASGYIAEFRQKNDSNSAQILIDSPSNGESRPVLLDMSRAGVLQWSIGQGYLDTSQSFHISTSTLQNGYTGSKLSITPSGSVTTSSQPRANIAKTGGQTLIDTATKITFTSETYDVGDNFSSSRYTAPVSGYYLVSTSLNISASANNVTISVYKNGAIYGGMNFVAYGANIRFNYSITGVVYLSASDYIEIFGVVNTGTLAVDNAGFLSVALLG